MKSKTTDPCMKDEDVALYREPSGLGTSTHGGVHLLCLNTVSGGIHTPPAELTSSDLNLVDSSFLQEGAIEKEGGMNGRKGNSINLLRRADELLGAGRR